MIRYNTEGDNININNYKDNFNNNKNTLMKDKNK